LLISWRFFSLGFIWIFCSVTPQELDEIAQTLST
jgi:hypothetical protein